jgi:hypothetical protein
MWLGWFELHMEREREREKGAAGQAEQGSRLPSCFSLINPSVSISNSFNTVISKKKHLNSKTETMA